MNPILYGNGINDDYPAIQQLLDSGKSEIILPAPEKHYIISQTLKIHGGQTLKLGQFTTVRLMAGANCAMVEDDDFHSFKENVCIDGGIWDMNNAAQAPNPYHFADANGETLHDKIRQMGGYENLTAFPPIYTGICMRFCRIRGLTLKNMTIKNPVIYGVQMGYVENFTVSDIQFDYTVGAPKLWNMDGIHVEGHCKNGVIRNLKGACHDDTVAITADDSLYGPIENIVVDGIFAEGAHSAVRLLSHGLPVKNIRISNVYGSYYTYCIGLTKYHGGEEERGMMKNILIENVAASASQGTADVKGGYYPLLWVQKGLDIEGLSIQNVERVEAAFPTPFFKVDEGATVKNLRLCHLHQKNNLQEKIPMLLIEGDAEITEQKNIIDE